METPPENNKNSKLSPAGWIAILVLLGLFGVSLWYAVKVWTSMAGVHMSGWGWLFLGLGVVSSSRLRSCTVRTHRSALLLTPQNPSP